MKILLVNPPYEERVYLHPPLGMCYIASVLQREGYEVRILDFPAEKKSPEDYRKTLRKYSPDLVGIYAMTPHINSAAEVAKNTRKTLPDSSILLGGPHVTVLPENTMKEIPEVDIAVLGEGEETITGVMSAIKKKTSFKGLKGTVYRTGKSIKNNGIRGYIKNLDSLPFPDRDLLLGKYHKSLGKNPYATMMTSRGCPYSCSFCAKEIFGRTYRSRSVENIIDEIVMLKEKYRIKELVFFDDSFTLKKERIMKLCDGLIKEDLDIQWKCETRVDLVDRELLKKMNDAGCYLIAYGVESGVQKSLDFLNKRFTIEQTKKAIQNTKAAGIMTQAYLIIGVPGETRNDVKKTIDFAMSLDLDFAQFSLLVPFPGTELYKYADEKGMVQCDDWSSYTYFGDSSKSILGTEAISVDELERIRDKTIKSFYLRPNYLIKRFNNLLKYNDISTIIHSLGILTK